MSKNEVRSPVVAGQFYDGSRASLERSVRRCVAEYQPPEDLGVPVGGVVPHAGWVFSGPTAAKVFLALSQKARPETYILLGAVHQWGVGAAEVFPRGAWATPLGEAKVDADLAAAILKTGKGLFRDSTAAHEGEHSIEVEVPFVQALSPDAAIVPIAVPPGPSAVRVGEVLGDVVKETEKRAVVVASSDLTHYGMGYGLPDRGSPRDAKTWMTENDRRIIRLIEALDAEAMVPEAERNHNACGAGAIAAATSAARALGATSGRVLEYTTSADVMQERYTDRAVGYVGIVFERRAETT